MSPSGTAIPKPAKPPCVVSMFSLNSGLPLKTLVFQCWLFSHHPVNLTVKKRNWRSYFHLELPGSYFSFWSPCHHAQHLTLNVCRQSAQISTLIEDSGTRLTVTFLAQSLLFICLRTFPLMIQHHRGPLTPVCFSTLALQTARQSHSWDWWSALTNALPNPPLLFDYTHCNQIIFKPLLDVPVLGPLYVLSFSHYQVDTL